MSAYSIERRWRPSGYYDRHVARYDALHRRWLRYAGGEAQAAVEAVARTVITKDMHLLDAGCGTGGFARRLIQDGVSPDRITLLDPSDAMVRRCADIPAAKVKGRMQALPMDAATFDVVTTIWSLETVSQVDAALMELGRVTKPGGILIAAFCAKRDTLTLGDLVLQHVMRRRGSGRFLSTRAVVDFLRCHMGFETRVLPCNGPASAILARKAPLPNPCGPGPARPDHTPHRRAPSVGSRG